MMRDWEPLFAAWLLHGFPRWEGALGCARDTGRTVYEVVKRMLYEWECGGKLPEELEPFKLRAAVEQWERRVLARHAQREG